MPVGLKRERYGDGRLTQKHRRSRCENQSTSIHSLATFVKSQNVAASFFLQGTAVYPQKDFNGPFEFFRGLDENARGGLTHPVFGFLILNVCDG